MSKKYVDDLAILNGEPSFAEKRYVGRPNIGDRKHLLELINDILDRRWLTNWGVCVQEFERRVAELHGVKHCIAMCNGTVALEIVIRALGLKGEVIVPSFTFVATAHALQWQEITPVFCDVDPDTYHIDPDQLARLITPRTTGIIGVHLFGRPCNVERIEEVAREYGLKVLFDAAHAFACSYKGKLIGNFGDAEVFSFHATKFFNTFEGGAVVTNDDNLAAKIRLMKNFGFAGYDQVIYIGTNGKMNEVSAAMGLSSLDSLDEFTAVNRRNFREYKDALAGVPGIRLANYDEHEKCNYQYIVLEIDDRETLVTRDELMKILHAENILARRYFFPGCHRMEPYRSYFPHAGLLLQNTERVAERLIQLPTGTAMSLEDVRCVSQVVGFVVENAAEVCSRIRR